MSFIKLTKMGNTIKVFPSNETVLSFGPGFSSDKISFDEVEPVFTSCKKDNVKNKKKRIVKIIKK